MKLTPDESTVAEFLRRLGHRPALIGRKPIDHAPKSMVIWPAEQSDPPDQACWLSRQYYSVYVNLNPLAAWLMEAVPDRGISVRDSMIAARRRVLIDVDGHDVSKEVAAEQFAAIRQQIGEPLAATDSGNGYGLIYTCTLPNDDPSKQRANEYLRRLKEQFPCVDTSVGGAARLTRCVGTLNRCVRTGERIPTRLLN